MRQTLPQRRLCHTFQLEYYGTKFDVSVGLFDDGRPAEAFVTGSKAGSEVQALSRDGAILLSLALQHGCPIDIIKGALTRTSQGAPQSFIGAMVDRIIEEKAVDWSTAG